MTLYGCPACNSTWGKKDEAAAHCRYSSTHRVVYTCACGRYRHCNLFDFIKKHLKGCDKGKAVFGKGFDFDGFGAQVVTRNCHGGKPASLTYPFSPTEIEEGAKEKESNEVMRPAFPAMSAPSRTLPALPRPVLEEQQRPTKRHRIEHTTRVPGQSASSISRLPPAMVPAPGTSTQSQSSTKKHPDPVNPPASPLTLASLGLPPPGPVLSSLIGQDATHMPFDDLLSNVIVAPARAAPSRVPNRNDDELHNPNTLIAPPFVAPPDSASARQNREFPAQVNAPTALDNIIDLTNDDDARAVVPATADVSNRPRHKGSSQVEATASRPSKISSGDSRAARPVTTEGGGRMSGPSTRASVAGERAIRSAQAATSRKAISTKPTAEELANAMPLSRYGPLGVPRKVEKKSGKQ